MLDEAILISGVKGVTVDLRCSEMSILQRHVMDQLQTRFSELSKSEVVVAGTLLNPSTKKFFLEL